jgi:hypothetical protein
MQKKVLGKGLDAILLDERPTSQAEAGRAASEKLPVASADRRKIRDALAQEATVIRPASVVVIAVCLLPTLASAQVAEFTVNVQSAAVRKGPSTGSPVVGQAPRGAILEVTRDIGAWVKVAWPEAPDGIGYVHLSMGKLSQRATREERLAAAFASLPPPEPVLLPDTSVVEPAASIGGSPSLRTIHVPPPTHVVGLAAR